MNKNSGLITTRVPFKGLCINTLNNIKDFIIQRKKELITLIALIIIVSGIGIGLQIHSTIKDYEQAIVNMQTDIANKDVTIKIYGDTIKELEDIHTNTEKNHNSVVIKQQEEIKKLKAKQVVTTHKAAIPSTSAPAASGQAYSPTETQTIIWNTMRSWGWSREVCAGIMGNIQQECGFNPYSGNRSNGYGICQWVGGRYEDLVRDYGTSLEAQLRYLHDSMQHSRYISILSLTSVDAAATQFCTKYERAGTPNMSKRLQYAANAYATFG